MNILEAGIVTTTNGLKGEIKVVPWTDDPSVYEGFPHIYLKKNDKYVTLKILGIKYQKKNVILKIEGYNTIEEAQSLINEILFVEREFFGELDKSTFFVTDLIGIDAYDVEGNLLGKLTDIFSTGSNDVYVIDTPLNKQILVPAIKQVVKDIDIQNRKIIIELVEGLI